MAGKSPSDKDASGTVARAVAVLRLVAEAREEVSITSLSNGLDLPASTVHRLLHLLIDQGMVEQRNRYSYGVGTEFYRLGSLVVGKAQISEIALPYMRELVALCDEYCMLWLYSPAERTVMIVETVSSSHPLRYVRDKFMPSGLAWGSSGRSVLAFLPEEDIVEVHRSAGPSSVSGAPLPPLAEFLAELDVIKGRGYAHSRGQKIDGAVGFGAPVYRGDKVIGSLCLTIPDIRYEPQREAELAAALIAQAQKVSFAIGGGQPSR